MPLAYIIITFEMGVLFAAFTAFFGVLYKARLLRLWDPLFEVDGFGETSIDRHWLRLVTEDPGIDAERVARSLDETNPIRVIRPEQPHGGEP